MPEQCSRSQSAEQPNDLKASSWTEGIHLQSKKLEVCALCLGKENSKSKSKHTKHLITCPILQISFVADLKKWQALFPNRHRLSFLRAPATSMSTHFGIKTWSFFCIQISFFSFWIPWHVSYPLQLTNYTLSCLLIVPCS